MLLNTQLEVRYRSKITQESTVYYNQQRVEMPRYYASLHQVNEERKSGTTLSYQSVQKETYMKEELNRHCSKSKSVDFNSKAKCKIETLSYSMLRSESNDLNNTPFVNLYSNRPDFEDTVRASQNQSLCNDETMKKVIQDIQLIKDFLIQRNESDRQKASSEEELKRQNDEKQLKIVALVKENEQLKKELEKQREQRAKLKALEVKISEGIFENCDNKNKAKMDMSYRAKLFEAISISNDSQKFDEHHES